MVDSENSRDYYETLKLGIGTRIKNPKLLKFVPDCLKTRKMCTSAVKKLMFVLMYVPDQYKTKKSVIKLFY